MSLVVNGVDVVKSAEMVDLVKNNRDMAEFTLRASTRWRDAGSSEITIHRNYGPKGALSSDEVFAFNSLLPPVWNENETRQGISACPIEMLLMSLSHCLTIGVTYVAANKGITIETLKVEVRGDLDLAGFYGLKAKRNGYKNLEIDFFIQSDLSQLELEALIEEVKNTSPVLSSLTNQIDDVHCQIRRV